MIWPVDGPSAGAFHRAVFETLCLSARAGDGNRTRMTSLEGFGYRGAELRLGRSAACWPVRECPRVPVICRPIGHATGTPSAMDASSWGRRRGTVLWYAVVRKVMIGA